MIVMKNVKHSGGVNFKDISLLNAVD